jgi:hypothetical protein
MLSSCAALYQKQGVTQAEANFDMAECRAENPNDQAPFLIGASRYDALANVMIAGMNAAEASAVRDARTACMAARGYRRVK